MTSDGNVRATPSDEKSSANTGPTSPATKTYVMSHSPTSKEDPAIWQEADLHPTLNINDGSTETRAKVLISSAEGSPAKTSPSPDAKQDSPASEADCSSSSSESLTLFSPTEDGSSLRMYPDFFHLTVDEISPSFSRRWPKSGFMTSPGECWTVDTSECPSAGDVSSSLEDVLLDEVPPRFYLSQKAAAGILRRASRRSKKLPGALRTALEALARSKEEGDGMEKAKTSSQSPSEPKTPSKADTETTLTMTPTSQPTRSPVRRLTPTECERLQGFPDGWTILRPTDDDTPPAETPSP